MDEARLTEQIRDATGGGAWRGFIESIEKTLAASNAIASTTWVVIRVDATANRLSPPAHIRVRWTSDISPDVGERAEVRLVRAASVHQGVIEGVWSVVPLMVVPRTQEAR